MACTQPQPRNQPRFGRSGSFHNTVTPVLKTRLAGSTFVFILMPEGRASEVGSYLPSMLLSRLPRISGPVASPAVVRNELAAVLSIDIAGFTRLTERLEQGHAEG